MMRRRSLSPLRAALAALALMPTTCPAPAQVEGARTRAASSERVAKPEPGVFGEHKPVRLDTLPADNVLRQWARPIGIVTVNRQTSQGICTAAVIAPQYVLTSSHCFVDRNEPVEAAELRLKRHAEGGKKVEDARFPLKVPAVQVVHAAHFTVLEVAEGNPAAEFGSVPLLVRDLQQNEPLAIVHSWRGSSDLSTSYGCEGSTRRAAFEVVKTPNPPELELILYRCDTAPGSSGALVFSMLDGAVIGLDIAANWDTNFGVAMREIVTRSPIVAAIAWIKPSAAAPTAPNPGAPVSAKTFPVLVSDEATLAEIKPGQTVELNGKAHTVAAADLTSKTISLTGDAGDLKTGLNQLKVLAKRMIFWSEKEKLSAFAEPYHKSYAIIAAIDDYARKRDPANRGPTGYAPLTGMRERAEDLRRALIGLGFPEANIITLYDEQATRGAIEGALGEFWQGGPKAGADRLIFYFGGHGDGERGGGYLATYDIDRKRGAFTGLLMSDFNGRQFPFIRVHHFLVALDSCSAGLAVPELQDGDPTPEQLAEFAKLNNIRSSTSDVARNLLVAGTADEKALSETGGVFTQALVQGLSGDADLIRDGVISFDELAVYVKERVSSRSAAQGINQNPRSFAPDRYGKGRVVFLLSRH